MKRKKRSGLHIVEQDDPIETAIHAIMEEIQEENDLLDELEDKIRRHQARFVRSVIIVVTAVVLALVGGYMYVTQQTYSSVQTLSTYSDKADSGEQSIQFAGGILKYSRDGVSFINRKGKEQWNSSYQIQNPIVSVKGDSAAIADKGGNDIFVFRKNGLKGEIHANFPVQKIAVSSQGIVSAVLKDETTSQIVCYDAAGNVLVEHKTTAASTGYPLDIDISDNGYMLLVSYVIIEDGAVAGRVAYYNFGEGGQGKDNNLVMEETYKGAVIPTVFFMNDEVSVIVTDGALVFYTGKETPKKSATINMENGIKSVFHNDKFVGVVFASDNKNNVRLYNVDGKQILSETFEGEYNNIKIEKNQIIMFDGKMCNIIGKNGVNKFQGELESDIMDMIPLPGINKYLVINANGLEEVRFAK